MFQQWVLFVIYPPFPDIQRVKHRIHPLYNSILMYYDKKMYNIIQYNIGI